MKILRAIASFLARAISGIGITRLFKPIKLNPEEITALNKLMPATIILTNTKGYLSNLFIEGRWDHAMIVSFDSTVVEATSKGIIRRGIVDALSDKSHFAVVHPSFAKRHEMFSAASYANSLVGKEYDFEFASDNDKYYCSELISAAYVYACGRFPTDYDSILGMPVVRPQHIFDSPDFFCTWER